MKVFHSIIAAFMLVCICSSTISAQDDREDVVYLKNGNIYRGIIVEQVPGQTMKVETIGGNVFTVNISDITKITKEKKVGADNRGPVNIGGPEYQGHMYRGDIRHPEDGGQINRADMWHHRQDRYDHHDMHGDRPYRDSTGRAGMRRDYKSFQYHKRGYFFEGQVLDEMGQGGIRLINGYKFGQFGYLGIGIGADLVGFAPIGHYDFGGHNLHYAGTYLPIFLHYSGDILRRRITPFYTVEGGYATRFGGGTTNGNHIMPPYNTGNFNNHQGGMMGGVGFGVKFYCRHRVNFNISANADYQSVKYNGNDVPSGNGMTWRSGSNLALLTPGLKFGIGF
jgi:hypothetical protein